MPRFLFHLTTATGEHEPKEVEGDDALDTLAGILQDLKDTRARIGTALPIGFRPPLQVSLEQVPTETYIIHATCNHVVKNKETGQTENGTSRPTISIEATSEAEAIEIATKQQEERVGTEWWPVVSFSLIPELVNVVGS